MLMLINYVKVNWLNDYLLKCKILIYEDIKTHKSCFYSIAKGVSKNIFRAIFSPINDLVNIPFSKRCVLFALLIIVSLLH